MQKFSSFKNAILILLLSALCVKVSSLQCPQFYDYSRSTVTCVSICPQGTTAKQNNCLTTKQYIVNGSVHQCQYGLVDQQKTMCCPPDMYPYTRGDVQQCRQCQGQKYRNTNLCCPGSTYLDFSNLTTSRCIPLGIGACPWFNLTTRVKVCCGTMYYHLGLGICVAEQNDYNCDSADRVCCSNGERVEATLEGYQCVSLCSWNNFDTTSCRKKQCSTFNQSLRSTVMMPSPSSLISFSGSCCYGLDPNGACITSWASCQQRVMNRGWSVCCRQGQFYSISGNTCSDICTGSIYLDIYCMSADGLYIAFDDQTGRPREVNFNVLCQGKRVNRDWPFCCPQNFYINSSQGCVLCVGRIYQTSVSQICCPKNYVYNSETQTCVLCQGIVNKQGSICCQKGQYFRYSVSGGVTCADTCSLDNMYNVNYCCDSLTNSSCSNRYEPSSCSYEYYSSNSRCSACPSFCPFSGALSNQCVQVGGNGNCQKMCQPATVFYPQLGECLSCDTSCLTCFEPFDPNSCSSCQSSYFMLQNVCTHCSQNCLECNGTINTCTACLRTGSLPILSGGQCLPYCPANSFYDQNSRACLNCSSNCLSCTTQNQCSKCVRGMFLVNGQCAPCGNNCLECYQAASLCYKCSNGFTLFQRQCILSCPLGLLTYYDVSLQGNICLQCHPSCNGCINTPQNCVSCTNNSFFLMDTLGPTLCTPCLDPCSECSSQTVCISCIEGYYLNGTQCLECSPNCRQCANQSTSCTACFGFSILEGNSCNGCSPSCSICQNTTCTQCQDSLFLFRGNCMVECPQSTFSSNNSCVQCGRNCDSCDNSTTCNQCNRQFPYQLNGNCVEDCPLNYEIFESRCWPVPINNGTSNHTVPNGSEETGGDQIFLSQSISMSDDNAFMIVVTTLQNLHSSTELIFHLYNTETHEQFLLEGQKIMSTQFSFRTRSHLLGQSPSSGNVTYQLVIPPEQRLRENILKTQVANSPNSTTYFNSRSIFDFIFFQYTTDPLQGLQYIGLFFTILISIYGLITKQKGHFIAEQSNTIILHMLNFIQVVYLFKFTSLHPQGFYHFLNGFGFMHYLWFPNFFSSAIPHGLKEFPAEKSYIPDGNFIRNAGASVSFLLLWVVITGLLASVCFVFYKIRKLNEIPWIRKIMRIGLVIIQVTFMNILFWSLTYLIQPMHTPSSFTKNTRVCAIIMLVAVLLICFAICLHFYKTYNSDVLEHYYTLREAAHYLIVLAQVFLFVMAAGKVLICLFLIALEVAWFVFNYWLYRYGQGDSLPTHKKFLISGICICIAYLFLSLSEHVHWIVIVVIVGIVVVVLIVYSTYQIVGLYYELLFREKVKAAKQSEQVLETNEIKTQI